MLGSRQLLLPAFGGLRQLTRAVPGPIPKPVANPLVVLREEFDDWAVLFDPDTGNAYGLNPTGVFVWKRLDGRHTVDDLVRDIRKAYDGVPEQVRDEVAAIVDDLLAKGLAGTRVTPCG